MERIINVKVSGNHLTKDSKNAGTRGEANATVLRITFDEGWDGYAKSVLFRDAHGMNPTRWTLTTNLLENIEESTRIYLLPIPPEPLAVAGEMSFSVDGYIDGKRQRSVTDTLEVKDGIITDVVNDPTPTQAEQLQAQYESIIGDIQNAEIYKNEAGTYAENAKKSAQSAEQARTDVEALTERAEKAADEATESATVANQSAETATTNATEAKQAREATEILKQETTQQAEMALEYSDKASQDAQNAKQSAETAKHNAYLTLEDVKTANMYASHARDYCKRTEATVGKASYIGENGNWFAWDWVKQEFYDTGVKAQAGSTVYVGDNPPDGADVWIDETGEGVEIVQTPNDDKLNSQYVIPSMVTMNHYISKAVTEYGNNEDVLRVLEAGTVFEDLEWTSDKETKMFILKKGLYYFGSSCEFETKEDGICFITRNALEYHETYYFLTFICESGIKFFDFVDCASGDTYDTDSPNREFSFANVDSYLTFESISASYTTLECIHLMSPSGTAYRITVNDDGELEATSHDEL